jgi:hypothetical protein
MYSSPFAPAVAKISGFKGLNWRDLIAAACVDVRDTKASLDPSRSFCASHKSKEPLSSAPAMIPLGWSSFGGAQAISWNLPARKSVMLGYLIVDCTCPHLESVLILAIGWSSTPCSKLSRFKSHSSNFVSSEKSASTAPALVPVTSMGSPVPGDHAKAAVLGISLNRTIAPSEVFWSPS